MSAASNGRLQPPPMPARHNVSGLVAAVAAVCIGTVAIVLVAVRLRRAHEGEQAAYSTKRESAVLP